MSISKMLWGGFLPFETKSCIVICISHLIRLFSIRPKTPSNAKKKKAKITLYKVFYESADSTGKKSQRFRKKEKKEKNS